MNPFAWIAKLRRRTRNEAIMAEELQTHLDMQIEENVRRGMSAANARYAALRAFGGVEQVKERCRDARGLVWLSQLKQDLEYAARSIASHRGFTAAAVLTLALGIGVNTTVFSLISDFILRPVYRNRTENLVALHSGRTDGDRSFRPFSYTEYTTIRNAKELFSDLVAMEFATVVVGPDDALKRQVVCLVSENYFSALHVSPYRGRFFTADEAAPSSRAHLLVASYELWQRVGAPQNFIGSPVRLNGTIYTVIGITPPGFGGLHWSIGPEAWLPLGVMPEIGGWSGQVRKDGRFDQNDHALSLFGPLQPGLSLDGAGARLGPLNVRLNSLQPAGSAQRELVLTPPPRTNLDLVWPTDESGLTVYAVAAMGMTLAVLLIACLNVSNMLFARGIARQKEIAIRLCLGASRGRVVRQLLVEGLVLALLGGLVGLLLSRWADILLLESGRARAGEITMHLRTRWDWPVLGSTFALCLVATLAFALLPALKSTRRNLVDDLKSQSGDAGATGRWNRFFALRHCLVMAQIAVSVMLLFAAGLLVHAVVNSERDRGFAVENRIVANIDYRLSKSGATDVLTRQKALLARLAAVPGVESVAIASALPYHFTTHWRPVFAVGAGRATAASDRNGEQGTPAVDTVVSDQYFATMNIAVLRGRAFNATEALQPNSHPLVILDESLARTLFGDANPIGQHISLSNAVAKGTGAPPELEVVGIVRSPREDAFQGQKPTPRIYRPLAQAPGETMDTFILAKLARGAAGPQTIHRFRNEAQTMEPNAVLACKTVSEMIGENLNVWSARVLSMLFAVFGVVAIVLAVVGMYGVKAHAAARRTREIGIRIAIGARPQDVVNLLLRQSVFQAAVGIVVGIALAVFTGNFLSKLLYRVTATDAAALLAATLPVGIVAIIACLIPAYRATRISPTDALRTE